MKQRHGFSLIELLVVLAVLSVVTTIGTTMFFKVNDLWRITSLRGHLSDAVGRVDNQMGRDFDMALSSTLSGVAVQGIRRQTEVPRGKLFQRLDDDSIIIPIEEVDLKTKRPRRYNVLYRIERQAESGPAGSLIRRRFPLNAPIPAEDGGMLVTNGVLAMRGEYFDGDNWLESWSRDDMPDAVRVSLILADENRPWEQISRTLTYALHVR